MKGPTALLVLIVTGLSGRTAAQHIKSEWPGPGAVGIGVSLSTPGGPGATLDVGIAGRLAARGRWWDLAGTVTRGAGLGLDLARAEPLRIYLTGMAGEVRCIGDPDGPGCPNSPGASFAWYAGGGGEFAVTQSHRQSFTIELGRWFTMNGRTIDPQEQPSRTVLAASFRWYVGRPSETR